MKIDEIIQRIRDEKDYQRKKKMLVTVMIFLKQKMKVLQDLWDHLSPDMEQSNEKERREDSATQE